MSRIFTEGNVCFSEMCEATRELKSYTGIL